MNTRENFWNVHCFATNQMRDETASDNRQTATACKVWIQSRLHTKRRASFLLLRQIFNFTVFKYWNCSLLYLRAYVQANNKYQRYFTEKRWSDTARQRVWNLISFRRLRCSELYFCVIPISISGIWLFSVTKFSPYLTSVPDRMYGIRILRLKPLAKKFSCRERFRERFFRFANFTPVW